MMIQIYNTIYNIVVYDIMLHIVYDIVSEYRDNTLYDMHHDIECMILYII